MTLKQINSTTWQATLPSGEKAFLGNPNSNKLEAHLMISRFGEEALMGIGFPLIGDLTNVTPKITGDTFELSKGDYKLQLYPDLKAGDIGGYEFKIFLGKKPPTNVLELPFDSQNLTIKSGMTVNGSIQTEVKKDALTVPSSAVKNQNGVSFVQAFATPLANAGGIQGVVSTVPPKIVEVTTGISDDTNIEIVSGLNEGEQIITRIISGTAGAKTTTATNRTGSFSGPGIRL